MASAEGESSASAAAEVSSVPPRDPSQEPLREILGEALRSLPNLPEVCTHFVSPRPGVALAFSAWHWAKAVVANLGTSAVLGLHLPDAQVITPADRGFWKLKSKNIWSAWVCHRGARVTVKGYRLAVLTNKPVQLNLGEDVVKINIDWSQVQRASPLQPMLLFTALQQHVSALQPFIEKLQSLIKEESTALVVDSNTAESQRCEDNSDVTDKELQMEEEHVACGSTSLKMPPVDFDPEVVQIKAGKAEIERRISAFIERKQAEINENNVREFCNVIDCNQENSCARTDAVFTPYPGFKSHVKVSRVVNTYGPQTRSESSYGSGHKNGTIPCDCGNQAIEERLQNIEAHLRLKTGGPVPKDIYQRIKKLEDKILELEGMSPEYFLSVNLSSKRRKAQQNKNYSLAELDEKINALKQTILRKTNEALPRVVDQLL